MIDYIQIITLLVYVACLPLAVMRRLYAGYWLAFFVFIVHSVLFYAAVNLQNAGVFSGVHTMIWGLGLRLHLGIVILGYLLHGRTK